MRKHAKWAIALAALASACGVDAPVTPARQPAALPSAKLGPAPRVQPAQRKGPLAAAISALSRPAPDRARDAHCHPAEVLGFFRVEPGQRLLELEPGQGYFTRILAEYYSIGEAPVGGAPRLSVLVPFVAAEAPSGPFAERAEQLRALLATLKFPVEALVQEAGNSWASPPRFERVLAIRVAHIWRLQGIEREMYRAVFDSLLPGGILGLVAHRAPKDAPRLGYLSEQSVIQRATSAGLVLDARSELNANPADTRDHPSGVWSLRPTLADGPGYAKIGESDRMTLRFRKPSG